MKKSDFAVALMVAGLTTSAYAQGIGGGDTSWIKSLVSTWIPLIIVVAAIIGLAVALFEMWQRGRFDRLLMWVAGCAVAITGAVVLRQVSTAAMSYGSLI